MYHENYTYIKLENKIIEDFFKKDIRREIYFKLIAS